jgi:predicted transposase YdaD
MCKAIDDMRKESKAEGISIGKAEGKAEKLNENIKTMHKNGANENLISKLLGLDISFVRKVLAE